jgi:hypothetical protein
MVRLKPFDVVIVCAGWSDLLKAKEISSTAAGALRFPFQFSNAACERGRPARFLLRWTSLITGISFARCRISLTRRSLTETFDQRRGIFCIEYSSNEGGSQMNLRKSGRPC